MFAPRHLLVIAFLSDFCLTVVYRFLHSKTRSRKQPSSPFHLHAYPPPVSSFPRLPAEKDAFNSVLDCISIHLRFFLHGIFFLEGHSEGTFLDYNNIGDLVFLMLFSLSSAALLFIHPSIYPSIHHHHGSIMTHEPHERYPRLCTSRIYS